MTRTKPWHRLSRTDDPPEDECRCESDPCRCRELELASEEAAADLRLLGRELSEACDE